MEKNQEYIQWNQCHYQKKAYENHAVGFPDVKKGSFIYWLTDLTKLHQGIHDLCSVDSPRMTMIFAKLNTI